MIALVQCFLLCLFSPAASWLLVLQNYYDNRYWTMWKLPMFGCTDPVQVGGNDLKQ